MLVVAAVFSVSTATPSGACLPDFNFSEEAFGFGLGACFAFVT